MSDIQHQIDQLRREQLILDLLSVSIRNQHETLQLDQRTLREQQDLLTKSASESAHLEDQINHLVARRDHS